MIKSADETGIQIMGVTFALLAAFGFSLKAIFIKLAYVYGVSAITLLSLRMIFSVPVFAWAAFKTQTTAVPLSRRDLCWFILTGCLGYYASSMLDFIGLTFISAGLERVILFTYPVITFLIAVLFQGKPITKQQIVAITLCYGGIAAVFAHDLQQSRGSADVLKGASLVMAASMCFALYLSFSSDLIQRHGVKRFTGIAMVISTIATLIHYLLTEPYNAIFTQSWQVYGLALAMGVFSTILPTFMQSAAILKIGAGKSALIGTVGPVMTLFFGWWWLNESITWWQIAGMMLVIAGVIMISRPNKAGNARTAGAPGRNRTNT